MREREGESEREEVAFLECAMGYGGTVIACWCIRACACVPEPVSRHGQMVNLWRWPVRRLVEPASNSERCQQSMCSPD